MKKLFFLFFFIFLPLLGFGAEISVHAKIEPQTIGLSQSAVFSIEVWNAKGKNVTTPQAKGLTFRYQGTSTSSSINIINGKMSSKTVHSYNFSVRASAVGRYVIPSITLNIKGKSYTTKPVTLKVVKQAQRRSNPGQSLLDQFFAQPKRVAHLYMRLYPKQPSVYQNQAEIVNLLIFSEDKEALDYQVVEVSKLFSDRALVYDISSTLSNKQQKIKKMYDQNGTLYYGKVIKRYVVFPVDKGKIALKAPRLVAISPAGQIEVGGENIQFASLPIGNQAGVAYIGKLEMNWEGISNQMEVGKTLDITIKMRGTGNLRILSNPYDQLQIPGVFLSAPRVDLHFDSWQNGEAFFVQTITYTLMAQKEGHFSIPNLRMEIYNHKMEPQTKTLKGFELTVLPSQESKKRLQDFGSPIAITKPHKSVYLLFHPLVIFILLLSLLMPLIAWPLGIHYKRLSEDHVYARKVHAAQRFGKYLKQAEESLQKQELKDFYHELEMAIFRFLTDRFGLPLGILLKELKESLKKNGVSEDLIQKSLDLLRVCQQNAYLPNADPEGAERLLEETSQLFGNLRKGGSKN